MTISKRNFRQRLLVLAIATTLPFSAMADDKYDLLQKQIELLQQQLQQVQKQLNQYKDDMKVKEVQVEKAVTTLKEDVAKAAEWKQPDTLFHMAGYADVGYTVASGDDGSFAGGSFSPIFHYQYRDKVMLESELEITTTGDGETNLEMEYLTIDYFLNDYIALVGGKFLSPIGQFRQNLHPSWVNKLASAPPGFGHDGAAPTSEVGLQARGGFPMGNIFANYAAYIGNGPELVSAFEDNEFELEGIAAEGHGTDADGEKVIGGRFGFLPLPGLEVGISAATGKATVTSIELEQEGEDPGFDLGDEQARNYDVFGADFVWSLNGIQLRGEYIKSKVGAANVGLTASAGATWESWYTQAAYLIPQTQFEPVIRYTDFNSPGELRDQTQWAFGLNYLISNNIMFKTTFELNDGLSGTRANDNRWLFQLAYGF